MKKPEEMNFEELLQVAEADIQQPEEARKMTRRSFASKALLYGTLGAVALETGGFLYMAKRFANFIDSNKYAARMLENIALEAELVGEYSGIGESAKKANDILKQNEVLKAEYAQAIAEQKAAQLQVTNAQLKQTMQETVSVFEEWQKIHAEYTTQFSKDQKDFGLLARRSKAVAFDTAINLDQILKEVQNCTADKLVDTQRKIYDWIGKVTKIEGLKYDPEKIKAFKSKYETLVNAIREIQANKRQIHAVDEKFQETREPGKSGLEYKPWVEYCKRRGQLEKTYLGIRKVEDGLHAVPDTERNVQIYKAQVNHWRKKAAELDAQINDNVEMVRGYAGKEIKSENIFDGFKSAIKGVVYSGAVLASIVTGLALGYGYHKIAGITGLDSKSAKLSEEQDLSNRQQQRLIKRRDLLKSMIPFMKRGGYEK